MQLQRLLILLFAAALVSATALAFTSAARRPETKIASTPMFGIGVPPLSFAIVRRKPAL